MQKRSPPTAECHPEQHRRNLRRHRSHAGTARSRKNFSRRPAYRGRNTLVPVNADAPVRNRHLRAEPAVLHQFAELDIVHHFHCEAFVLADRDVRGPPHHLKCADPHVKREPGRPFFHGLVPSAKLSAKKVISTRSPNVYVSGISEQREVIDPVAFREATARRSRSGENFTSGVR